MYMDILLNIILVIVIFLLPALFALVMKLLFIWKENREYRE